MNMILLVNRSDPERTIITKPMGKKRAPMVRMRPGKSATGALREPRFQIIVSYLEHSPDTKVQPPY